MESDIHSPSYIPWTEWGFAPRSTLGSRESHGRGFCGYRVYHHFYTYRGTTYCLQIWKMLLCWFSYFTLEEKLNLNNETNPRLDLPMVSLFKQITDVSWRLGNVFIVMVSGSLLVFSFYWPKNPAILPSLFFCLFLSIQENHINVFVSVNIDLGAFW